MKGGDQIVDDRSNGCRFKCRGDDTRGQRGVDDVGSDREQRSEAGFDKNCRKKIELVGRWFTLANSFCIRGERKD